MPESNAHLPPWFRWLARRGAFLLLRPDGADLLSPRKNEPSRLTSVSRAEIDAALAAGWLRPAGADRLAASRRGIAALRADLRRTKPQAREAFGRGIAIEGSPGRPQVNAAESPLAWLRSRRDKDGRPLISEAEFNAGERLRADFWFAQMTPRVTSTWTGLASSHRSRRAAPGVGIELQDSVIAARERVRRALEAVGPELSGILIDVCCHLNGLEEAERAIGLPQRSGKIVLHLALTRLARHYGLLPRQELSLPVRVRHWATTDYRPTAEKWG